MDVLIIVDNISLNYKWSTTFNTVKRWLVYWLNDNLVKNNFKSVTIGKTYPKPKLNKLIGNELNLSNIIVLLDSIIIKKTEIYNCVNIKYIFEMCSKNTYLNAPDTNKIIIKSKKIIIEDDGINNEINYSDIYVFSSILEAKLTEANLKYIDECLAIDNIKKINWVNFANKKNLPNNPKLLETAINFKHVNNYEMYSDLSQLLVLVPQKNDFNKSDSNINDIFQKLFEIEFENYKKSHWSENPITKDVLDIYLKYVELLNKNQNLNIDNMSGSCFNFIKYCVNWIRVKILENSANIDFNIGKPKVNNNSNSDYVFEIVKFYELVYPKILSYHVTKSNNKYIFALKKINQLNLTDIKIKYYPNDNSTNYLYSSTTMTNWKQEYENFNPFGLLVKYNTSNFSYRGIYENNILTTYPNIMISSVSNNWLSLFDYYQLVSAEIDSSTKTKFNIREYTFVDNLHGDTNIILPIYINFQHWELVKKYWSYHMSFINDAFEFDYVKKMDNIYFLTIGKMINIISNTKCNQNIIRLFFYILRTCIQICIDNKYSYNNKVNYDKYLNLLLDSDNLSSFNKLFIEYLIRVIQSILTSTIKKEELSEDMNKLINIYTRHLINTEYTVEYYGIIDAMSSEDKAAEIEILEEKISLNILCFSELKKDLEFFSALMNKIYSIKKFNQLIKLLDKNNGCIPIIEEDFNCEIIDSIINDLIKNQKNMEFNIKQLVISTGLIKI